MPFSLRVTITFFNRKKIINFSKSKLSTNVSVMSYKTSEDGASMKGHQ